MRDGDGHGEGVGHGLWAEHVVEVEQVADAR
jgi:hypothetical protein